MYGRRRQRIESPSMTRLNKRLHALSVAESESSRRNEQLLKDLNMVSKHASSVSEKTERLKQVRGEYQNYVSRLYPHWRQHMEDVAKQNSKKDDTRREAPRRSSSLKQTSSGKTSPHKSSSLSNQRSNQEKDMYHDFIHQKMDRWKHDTSLNGSEENLSRQHSFSNRYKPTSSPSSTSSNHKRNSVAFAPNNRSLTPLFRDSFLHMSELDDDIYDGKSPKDNQRVPFEDMTGAYLSVARDLMFSEYNDHYHQQHSQQHLDHRQQKQKQQLQQQQQLQQRILEESFSPSRESNSSIDLSKIRIIPQLLGINADGQLVLLPMSSPPNTSLPSNSISANLTSSPTHGGSQTSIKHSSSNDSLAKTAMIRGSVSRSSNTSLNAKPQKRQAPPPPLLSATPSPQHKEEQKQLQLQQQQDQFKQHQFQLLQEKQKQELEQQKRELENERQQQKQQHFQEQLRQQKQQEEQLQQQKQQQQQLLQRQRQIQQQQEQIKQQKEQQEAILRQIHNQKMLVEEQQMKQQEQEQQLHQMKGDTEPRTDSSPLIKQSSPISSSKNQPVSRGITDELEFSDEDNVSCTEKQGMDIIEELTEDSDNKSSKSTREPYRTPSLRKSAISHSEVVTNSPQQSISNNTSESQSKKQAPDKPTNSRTAGTAASESFFRNMSDQSDFELSSDAGDVKTKTTPKSATNNIESKSSNSKQVTSKPGDFLEEMSAEEPALGYVIGKIIERVQDEDNEEVISLNLQKDLKKANTVIGTCELEGSLDQFSTSEMCMAYRYHLEQVMRKRSSVKFFAQDLDPNNDFEGSLRDCINPCYMEIWDSLFIFLSEIMGAFEFDPNQVAGIYAETLIPNDPQMLEKFKLSLAKILESIAEQTDDEEFSDTEESQGPESERGQTNDLGEGNSSHVTISEDFSKKGDISLTSTPNVNTRSKTNVGDSPTDEGDLSKSLSLEKDDDTSSTVSFDSDGLPVQKSEDSNSNLRGGGSHADDVSDKSNNSNSGSNKDFTGSKAYQKVYRESVMSPVDEDLDDDEGLDDFFGESIGLNKKNELKSSHVKESPVNDHSTKSSAGGKSPSIVAEGGGANSSNISIKKKLKPGFWDHSDSESEWELSNTGGTMTTGSMRKADQDDDFDFDFYD